MYFQLILELSLQLMKLNKGLYNDELRGHVSLGYNVILGYVSLAKSLVFC